MNISVILSVIRPGAQWSLNGDEYDGLEWLDDSPKPTLADIEEALPTAQAVSF